MANFLNLKINTHVDKTAAPTHIDRGLLQLFFTVFDDRKANLNSAQPQVNLSLKSSLSSRIVMVLNERDLRVKSVRQCMLTNYPALSKNKVMTFFIALCTLLRALNTKILLPIYPKHFFVKCKKVHYSISIVRCILCKIFSDI